MTSAAGVANAKARAIIARSFIDDLNSRTVCAQCGAQPIEWHNPEHVELNRRVYRIGSMVYRGRSVAAIQAEIARCTPLCRSCHMRVDGRLLALRANQPKQSGDRHPPKPCTECERPYKPLRRGLCSACSQRRAVVSKRDNCFALGWLEKPISPAAVAPQATGEGQCS